MSLFAAMGVIKIIQLYCTHIVRRELQMRLRSSLLKKHLKEIINERRNSKEFFNSILLPSVHYGQEGAN